MREERRGAAKDETEPVRSDALAPERRATADAILGGRVRADSEERRGLGDVPWSEGDVSTVRDGAGTRDSDVTL